jgi:hypothetical protein
MNIFELYTQFKQNPVALLQKKYNIPAELTDPNEIMKHLMSTGQVTQQQINQAMNMSRMFRR